MNILSDDPRCPEKDVSAVSKYVCLKLQTGSLPFMFLNFCQQRLWVICFYFFPNDRSRSHATQLTSDTAPYKVWMFVFNICYFLEMISPKGTNVFPHSVHWYLIPLFPLLHNQKWSVQYVLYHKYPVHVRCTFMNNIKVWNKWYY